MKSVPRLLVVVKLPGLFTELSYQDVSFMKLFGTDGNLRDLATASLHGQLSREPCEGIADEEPDSFISAGVW